MATTNLTPKLLTVQEYINENLQLKTLKITKYQFERPSENPSISRTRHVSSSHTARNIQKVQSNTEPLIINANPQNFRPKLSHRRLMNEPKMLLSVEKRKWKSFIGNTKGNVVKEQPSSRLGFVGEKVRATSAFNAYADEKNFQKLLPAESKQKKSEKINKKTPYMNFNYKYVLESRKQSNRLKLSDEEKTKKGTNQAYFAYFNSENFTRELTSKIPLYSPAKPQRPSTQGMAGRRSIRREKDPKTTK